MTEPDPSRPGSAQNAPLLQKQPSKADQQRLEKIQLLREKQNSERLKKLEELKEHVSFFWYIYIFHYLHAIICKLYVTIYISVIIVQYLNIGCSE